MARDIEASSIASHIDLFFDELHRIDVAYSDYARRAGVSDNVMCILDYLKDHDGASQRAICEYTLLPRQTVNNVIASFVAHGFVELGDAEGDRRVKTVRFTPAGRRYCNSLIAPSRAAEYRAMSELPDELRSALLKGMGVSTGGCSANRCMTFPCSFPVSDFATPYGSIVLLWDNTEI